MEADADPVVIVAADGSIQAANPSGIKLFALPRGDVRGQPLGSEVPPDGASDFIVERGGKSTHMHAHTTTIHWGDEPAHIITLRDPQERRRIGSERARLTFLAEVGAALNTAHDPVAMIQNIAELVVPRYADLCILDLLDTTLERVRITHADPARAQRLRELGAGQPPPLASDHPVAMALRDHEPLILDPLHDDALRRLVPSASLEEARSLRFASLLAIPLIGRAGLVGCLTLISEHRFARRYDSFDLVLARELGHRIGMAVEHAKLFRLAERRAQASAALEHVGEGVILVDARGFVRLTNPAARNILRRHPSEIEHQLLADALPSWSELDGHIPISGSVGSDSAPNAVLPLDIDGDDVWISISGTEFDSGTVYTFCDVTAEHALRDLQSDFLATASHELRTPVTTIHGAAETLFREDIEISDEIRDQMMLMVRDESRRLSTVVEEILTAGQLEAGKMRFETSPIDLCGLAESTCDKLRMLLGQDQQLVFTGEPDTLVAGDRVRISQVLVNLIENAIKYSPDGGSIGVRVEAGARHAILTVTDQGIGIPDGDVSNVFQKFFRVDPQMLRGIRGTGLGLYICRELVNRMGGEIEATSRHGVGSTFTVRLPLAGTRLGS